MVQASIVELIAIAPEERLFERSVNNGRPRQKVFEFLDISLKCYLC